MKIFTYLCVNHPLSGWLVIAVFSIPPLLGFAGYRVADPVPAGWVPAEVLEELRASERQFQSNTPIVLVFESDDFFQRDRIAALQHTAAELRKLKEVIHLTWMGDIPEVTLNGHERLLLPEIKQSGIELDLADSRQALLNHPLVAGHMLSQDGRTVLMLIDANKKEHVDVIRSAAARSLGTADIRLRTTGTLALYNLHDRALAGDHIRIQLLAYLLVGGLQILIFRHPIAILINCSGAVVGVIWTLGWLKLIGQSDNELAKIILPVMVIMIGFTDGVHFVSRLRQLRSAGKEILDAVEQTIAQTGPACLLTSLTTAVGFGSLMLSRSDVIAGFGRISAIGVIVTFLAVVMISPLLSVSWPGRRMRVSEPQQRSAHLMNRFAWVVTFSVRNARLMTFVGIAITLIGLVMCAQLVPDERVSDRVPQKSEEWQAMQHCDTHVGGIRSLRLLIRWPESASRKEVWSVVRECESLIKQQPEFGPPLSIRTALSVFKGQNHQDHSVLASRLPDSLKHRFYRPEERSTIVVTRMQDLGFATLGPVLSQLESKLLQIENNRPGFQVELQSDVLIEGSIVAQLIDEMMHSLMMAAVIIFVVLAIAFRSWRIGLISIIPNIMPLSVSGAVCFLSGGSLNIAGTCSFAICLGIAVDDTIHYLHHYTSERRRGCSVIDANQKTFVAVGSALVMTTVVMIAGLGTVLTSQLPPHVSFSTMACVTLAVALPADLVFLPALLSCFPGRETSMARQFAEEEDKMGSGLLCEEA